MCVVVDVARELHLRVQARLEHALDERVGVARRRRARLLLLVEADDALKEQRRLDELRRRAARRRRVVARVVRFLAPRRLLHTGKIY